MGKNNTNITNLHLGKWGKIVGEKQGSGEKKIATLWHVWNVEYSDDYNFGVYLFSTNETPTKEEIRNAFLTDYEGEETRIDTMLADNAYFVQRVYCVDGFNIEEDE